MRSITRSLSSAPTVATRIMRSCPRRRSPARNGIIRAHSQGVWRPAGKREARRADGSTPPPLAATGAARMSRTFQPSTSAKWKETLGRLATQSLLPLSSQRDERGLRAAHRPKVSPGRCTPQRMQGLGHRLPLKSARARAERALQRSDHRRAEADGNRQLFELRSADAALHPSLVQPAVGSTRRRGMGADRPGIRVRRAFQTAVSVVLLTIQIRLECWQRSSARPAGGPFRAGGADRSDRAPD